jgi:hypothetical protein
MAREARGQHHRLNAPGAPTRPLKGDRIGKPIEPAFVMVSALSAAIAVLDTRDSLAKKNGATAGGASLKASSM